jgi:hypothetical protein
MFSLYENQRKAGLEIINNFHEGTLWNVLLAQMQSGKTGAYNFVACETIRHNLKPSVLIFTGTSDTELMKQTRERFYEFVYNVYSNYLEDEGLSREDRDLLKNKIKKNTQIYSPCQLKKIKKKITNSLLIQDESHYAQNIEMGPYTFLQSQDLAIYGNPDGTILEKTGNIFLSVSATPFSEIINMKKYNDPLKRLVIMENDPSYTGVKKLMECDRIQSFEDPLEAFEEALSLNYRENKYAVVRVPSQNSNFYQKIAANMKWKIKYFDSNNDIGEERRILSIDELSEAPSQPTVIFIKEMLRMGKTIPKEHLAFVMETAKNSKTDTLLQGLVGRICGYYDPNFDVYALIHVSHFHREDIYKYIGLCNGEEVMPSYAMNVKPERKYKNSKLNFQELSSLSSDLEKINTLMEMGADAENTTILEKRLPRTTGKEMYYVGKPTC